MTREYRTAAAFRQALEQRLRSASTSGVDFARRRQLVVFDRFLARIALEFGDAVTLEGGLAPEHRKLAHNGPEVDELPLEEVQVRDRRGLSGRRGSRRRRRR